MLDTDGQPQSQQQGKQNDDFHKLNLLYLPRSVIRFQKGNQQFEEKKISVTTALENERKQQKMLSIQKEGRFRSRCPPSQKEVILANIKIKVTHFGHLNILMSSCLFFILFLSRNSLQMFCCMQFIFILITDLGFYNKFNMKLAIFLCLLLLINLTFEKAPPKNPTTKDLKGALKYAETTDENVKKLDAPSKDEYIKNHPELEALVNNNQIAQESDEGSDEGENADAPAPAPAEAPASAEVPAPSHKLNSTEGHLSEMKHQVCGDVVNMIFDVAEKMVEATVGDVSTCGYGLRTSTVYVLSKGPTLYKEGQYVDSGVIQRQFYPSTLYSEETGGGLYRKTGGSATGANGIVKFRIGNSGQWLVTFFENSWNGWYLGIACIYNSDYSNRDIYNQIYYTAVERIDFANIVNFWPHAYAQCIGTDIRLYSPMTLTFDIFGQRITLNTKYTQNDLTSAQRCKLVSLSVVIG